ncbi:tetratricopeptide repeat protein [Bdellovibrio svalbardensis]|uniref:Tetratricopeptide repeat protein n=1 Tax=Bdellovibrio svalbardensis TaxID=2972972 RepID=A0ABT6DLL9_9BACT|nr:hypothetical protein [Bdellovibrio svalbardensis]MDG0817770.1 hypothetical protein [Bdellovibrio svalbardensis]
MALDNSDHCATLKIKISSFQLGIFAFLLVVLSSLLRPGVKFEEKHLILPPPQIERFSFGYSEVVADVFWIRILQDFDYCDEKIVEGQCRNNSWMFQMLDVTTKLAPHFRIAYAAGGISLTVLVGDLEGATKIFERGVQMLPHDWTISYRAAYHYLYEVKDKKRAAELLIQAGQNGAPPWVFTLAGRLYSDSGELDLAQNLLQEMKDTNQDETLIKRLQDKIDSMKASKVSSKQ